MNELLIAEIKPDMKSMVHFFDNHHKFYTKVDVYFTHNKQKLRAILLFPFQQEHFGLDKIEVFYNDEWREKKGNTDLYGMSISQHSKIEMLRKKIREREKRAKNQLESRFRTLVSRLAIQFAKEMQSVCPTECEVSDDYLSIIVKVVIGEEMVSSRMETTNYFPHTSDDKETLHSLVNGYKARTLEKINDYKQLVKKEKGCQNIYVTTFPYDNPIADLDKEKSVQSVSVHTEGFCQECKGMKLHSICSYLELNPKLVEKNNENLLIHFVGDRFICPDCKSHILKEKVVIRDTVFNRNLHEKEIDACYMLGSIDKEKEILHVLNVALNHREYFNLHKEQFWNAYSFIALQNWDVFVNELTRGELVKALGLFTQEVNNDITKAELLKMLRQLSLSDAEKMMFWKNANEEVIHYYLMITVFGWRMQKEIDSIGRNRAEFIFRFLPCPSEIEEIRKEHVSRLFIKTPEELALLQDTISTQKSKVSALRQENGRLMNKLGEAYKRIALLEQETCTVSTEIRNKDDIQKIHHLKGLIEELKNEIDQLSVEKGQVEIAEEIQLTEEPIESEDKNPEEILKGKNILVLGGYRSSKENTEQNYRILSHDTRRIDPSFYEHLKNADIIVVLTRYISHRAMWEAKEFAILEQKPIYYTSFTNIPTIVNMIANQQTNEK